MTFDQRSQNISREAILALLSDAETAKVSNAESAAALQAEAEYLDLDQLERGVQLADGTQVIEMGHVLPRSAVGADTWDNIVGKLADLVKRV